MAKIFFSLAGEGRGHATRVRTLVEALRDDHQVTVFAPGEAGVFLLPLYQGTNVCIRRMPGLQFEYTEDRRIDFRRTIGAGAQYLGQLPRLIRDLERVAREERPDLMISDFEPALPRVARKLGIPLLSIDHQHFLSCYDLSSLPIRLRWHAAYMGWVVRALVNGQRETVVSSFYFPPLRKGCRSVTQVGVMLRPEVRTASVFQGSHLVAYWRRFAPPRVMDALASIGREVRVYGLGVHPRRGGLVFCQIDEHRFLEDLATCDALISTAGNQLVGEALFLNKPVLALPEARNFEQYLNAEFLRLSGAGHAVELERVTAKDLRLFLDSLDHLRPRIDRPRMDGLQPTLAVIRKHLPISASAREFRPRGFHQPDRKARSFPVLS
ncbi:MAG: glycosyltransferase [Verrucomicrobiales bacterium]|nr:glycosyltransferase [Verrucomicrobiales bacterium]